jgi:hypothetical protein
MAASLPQVKINLDLNRQDLNKKPAGTNPGTGWF